MWVVRTALVESQCDLGKELYFTHIKAEMNYENQEPVELSPPPPDRPRGPPLPSKQSNIKQ